MHPKVWPRKTINIRKETPSPSFLTNKNVKPKSYAITITKIIVIKWSFPPLLLLGSCPEQPWGGRGIVLCGRRVGLGSSHT